MISLFKNFNKRNLLLLIPLFMTACSKDFNPNAEWKETTLVYGLLDQDADTTWVRIQRCFLGEGNLLEFAKEADSNYYREDELMVTLTEYNGTKSSKGTPTGKEFTAQRTVVYGSYEGAFYSKERPVYFFVTEGKLQSNRVYELKIENVRTGNIVSAVTMPIEDGIRISYPYTTFEFAKVSGRDRYAEIKWITKSSAIGYQPSYELYYFEKESGETKKIEHIGPIVKEGINNTQTSSFYQSTYLSLMREEFTKENYSSKSLRIVDSLSVILSAADQELSDYINFNGSENQSGGFQEKPIYTNIVNGVGIFASRRTITGKVPFSTRTTIAIHDSLSYWFE